MRTEGGSPKSRGPMTIKQGEKARKHQDPRVSFIRYVKLFSHAGKRQRICVKAESKKVTG